MTRPREERKGRGERRYERGEVTKRGKEWEERGEGTRDKK
jgi:hypothetical protein